MRLPHMPRFIAALALALALFCSSPFAQVYPAKAVRIIVPVGTGGATDILSRTLGQRLSAIWGQQVLVDNRPGGGSNVGFEIAAKAAPDGYTLLMAQPAFTVNVSLYKKLAYDPLRDFSAVTLAATGANVLVVHPAVPAPGRGRDSSAIRRRATARHRTSAVSSSRRWRESTSCTSRTKARARQ
jgi:tripartite-type tricarboxylate transporter receptor subunit TctC